MSYPSTPVRKLRTCEKISFTAPVALAHGGFVPWRDQPDSDTAVLCRLALARVGERGIHGWQPSTSVQLSQRSLARLARTTRARVRAIQDQLGSVAVITAGRRITQWEIAERPRAGWIALDRLALERIGDMLGLDDDVRRGQRTEREAAFRLLVWLACQGSEVHTTLTAIADACGMAVSRARRAIRAAADAGIVAVETVPGVGHSIRVLVDLIEQHVERNRSVPVVCRRLTELLVSSDADLARAELWSSANRRLVTKFIARGVPLERLADMILQDGPLSTARRPAGALHARLRRIANETAPSTRNGTNSSAALGLFGQADHAPLRSTADEHVEQDQSAEEPPLPPSEARARLDALLAQIGRRF